MEEEQQIQQQIIQLVQAAIQGNQQAAQQIQQIMQAAQQGDQQAIQLAQMIQAIMEQMQQQQVRAAKFGAKLNYIKKLRGLCPEGQEMAYFKKGGQLCKKCVAKQQTGGKTHGSRALKVGMYHEPYDSDARVNQQRRAPYITHRGSGYDITSGSPAAYWTDPAEYITNNGNIVMGRVFTQSGDTVYLDPEYVDKNDSIYPIYRQKFNNLKRASTVNSYIYNKGKGVDLFQGGSPYYYWDKPAQYITDQNENIVMSRVIDSGDTIYFDPTDESIGTSPEVHEALNTQFNNLKKVSKKKKKNK